MSGTPQPAMPEAGKSGIAPVNGIVVYYAGYGAGEVPPVLLIHGGPGHGDLWAAQVAGLMTGHRVIAAATVPEAGPPVSALRAALAVSIHLV
jgi:pimeloyl-ACP methyl ester carboxylesterase